jgi:hypothetical protein
MTPDACLYPAFTQHLLRRLRDQRRSVNLVGQPEDGRRRVIDDLCALAPAEISVLRANCHDWRKHYPGLIEHLWLGLGLNHGKKKPPTDLAGLMPHLENAGTVWLVLDEFDNLMEVPDAERDPRYTPAFFEAHLNSLKNLPNLCLLTVAAKFRQECKFPCHGVKTSPPDLEQEPLPPLGRAELRAELQRRLPGLDAVSIDLSVDALYQRTHSRYACLEYLAGRWQNQADDHLRIVERLHLWQRDFDKERKKIHLGSIDRWMRWLLVRLRLSFNWAMALLLEVSLLRKLWEKLSKLWRGKKPGDPS